MRKLVFAAAVGSTLLFSWASVLTAAALVTSVAAYADSGPHLGDGCTGIDPDEPC